MNAGARIRDELETFQGTIATMIPPRQASVEADARTIATMISPEAEAYRAQATLDHHLANVRIAEQQFRAVVWNLLVFLASDHNGPEKPEVVVARWGYPSAFGALEHIGVAYGVGKEPEPVQRFMAEQICSVTEANGYITLNIS